MNVATAIPLLGGKEYYPTTDELITLRSTYPGVDIDQQMLSARSWCLGHPTQLKTQGYRFLDNWMKKAQNDLRLVSDRKPPEIPQQRSDSPDLIRHQWIATRMAEAVLAGKPYIAEDPNATTRFNMRPLVNKVVEDVHGGDAPNCQCDRCQARSSRVFGTLYIAIQRKWQREQWQ